MHAGAYCVSSYGEPVLVVLVVPAAPYTVAPGETWIERDFARDSFQSAAVKRPVSLYQ